eukprot:GHVS01047328.1.p1 GENE.GHVS01047328.1~~GHVS01047328.1.p1  ORF type:complete len:216 (-),score=34.81 GHVS01047328.1:102-749(-)
MKLPIFLFLFLCLCGVDSQGTATSSMAPPNPPKVSPVTIVYRLTPDCLDERAEVARRAVEGAARELVVGAGGWVEVKMLEAELGNIEERHVISVRYNMQIDSKRESMVKEMDHVEEEIKEDSSVWKRETNVFPISTAGQTGQEILRGSSTEQHRREEEVSAVECQAFVTWMVHISIGTLTTNCGDPERWVVMAYRAMEFDKCVSVVFLDSAAHPV